MFRTVPGAWVRAVLGVLLITGCTSTIEGQPRPVDGSAASASEGASQKAPRPADRDMQAVTAALRQLDACAVFDLNAAKTANPTASLLPIGPHACMLAPTPNYNPAQDGVKVFVGDAGNDYFRIFGAPVTIAGAKAYERRDYSDPTSTSCEIDFPVSFSRAINFQYEADDTDTCQVLHQIAAAAVARLQNPDTLTVDTAKRPFAAWDGCFFLAQLLGKEAQNNDTYEPDGIKDPFSGCKTTLKQGQNRSRSWEQRNEPKLEIAYEQAPPAPKQARQVAGKTAEVTTFSTSCRLTWNQADSQTGSRWYAALVISVTASTCDTAAQLAERAIAFVDQQPSDAAAPKQRPLLYKPEDNDNPEPGACADWGGDAGCEPYHPVPLPQGIESILAAADRDQNVTCAVFQDAVKAVFGPTFNPMTWAAHCFFVEATHTLRIRVNADPDNEPGDYGRQTDLWTDRQEIQIAGKPAVIFWDHHRSEYDVYLSPFGDLTRKGNLHINLQAIHGRGNSAPSAEPPKLDAAKADLAKQVIKQVTEKYVTR